VKLEGSVVVITGGCSGIGKAASELFLSEGAGVAILDKAASGPRISAHGAGKALFLRGDVAREADVERMMKRVWRRFGRLDILLNNAGEYFNKDLIRCSLQEWNTVLGENLTGIFLCCKYAVPYMLRSGAGNIVNISSNDAVIGEEGATAYCAAKGGVLSFTRALAKELAKHNIRVNSIAPGPIATPMFKRHNSLREAFYIKKSVPLGRLGRPGDVAKGALFLASEDSSYITGQVLVIDGGIA